jgi:hypothetical protein
VRGNALVDDQPARLHLRFGSSAWNKHRHLVRRFDGSEAVPRAPPTASRALPFRAPSFAHEQNLALGQHRAPGGIGAGEARFLGETVMCREAL